MNDPVTHCRKCRGLLYLDLVDPLLKCYNCGQCYYTSPPSRYCLGPKGQRLPRGSSQYSYSKLRDAVPIA